METGKLILRVASIGSVFVLARGARPVAVAELDAIEQRFRRVRDVRDLVHGDAQLKDGGRPIHPEFARAHAYDMGVENSRQ
jgi:hypothetical protein